MATEIAFQKRQFSWEKHVSWDDSREVMKRVKRVAVDFPRRSFAFAKSPPTTPYQIPATSLNLPFAKKLEMCTDDLCSLADEFSLLLRRSLLFLPSSFSFIPSTISPHLRGFMLGRLTIAKAHGVKWQKTVCTRALDTPAEIGNVRLWSRSKGLPFAQDREMQMRPARCMTWKFLMALFKFRWTENHGAPKISLPKIRHIQHYSSLMIATEHEKWRG